MIDKRVIAIGFMGGVAIGLVGLTVNGRAEAPESADAETQHTTTAVIVNQPRTDPSTAAAPQPSELDQMVAEVMRKQGGKISLRQLQFLSQIAAISNSRAPYPSALPGGSIERGDSAGALLQSIMGPRAAADTSASTSSRSALVDDPSASFGRSFDPSHGAHTVVQSNVGAIDVRTGQFLAPAGPGAYVDPRDGTVYAPAGPNGIVNTRTGDYSPVPH